MEGNKEDGSIPFLDTIVKPEADGMLSTSGRLSPNANITNGLWTRWRKDPTGLPVRLLMGLNTKALQLPRLPLMEFKLRVTLSYPTHKVFVKASKRSVVDMAFKPTSKVAAL